MWPTIPQGTVSIVDTAIREPGRRGAVHVGGSPTAIAITNKGTGNVSDDTVFVTQIFAELNPDFNDPTFDGNGEARDLGKQGVVHAFPAGNANPPITKITLAPRRFRLYRQPRELLPEISARVPTAHSLIFCPDPDLPATDPVNTNNPQGVFPNQLLSALIRGNRLYLPNIGAQPEPPEIFNANVQALVYSVDTRCPEGGAGRTRQPEQADRRGGGRAAPQSRQDLRQRHRGHRCQRSPATRS